jgi:putative transposase
LISAVVLKTAYRNEKDADVRERILLVTRVRTDKEEASSVAEKEFHRSRWWAYKWLKRFDNAGLKGLKNKHRSGRPPEVSSEETSIRIRGELSENQSGWMVKEVMNLIYERTGVNIMRFTSTDYCINGVSVSPKVPTMRFVNAASKQDKNKFRKRQEG